MGKREKYAVKKNSHTEIILTDTLLYIYCEILQYRTDYKRMHFDYYEVLIVRGK